MKAHLSRQPHINPNLPPRDLDQEATALLERLSIMRVFSFEGLAEALSEFKSTCDSHATPPANSPTPNPPPMKSTIPDSQANEEDEDLFALQVQEPTTTNHPSPSPQPSPQAQPPSSPISRKLLIIDDLSTIFSPLQRQSYTQSSALLASLLRSTHHLATTHPLSVLLMNSTYAPALSRPSPRRPDDTATASERKPPPRGPSIFASCAARPMFGHVLDQGAGLHCLVHRVPRTAGDAGRAYGEKEGEGRERGRGVGWVNCLEVVGDRDWGRGQRFGFFEVGRGGLVGDWSGGGR
ncbi:hypothetical protein C1H76_9671 [Elsinoe australis]|uniref:DNA recombination and repair protein Rad51-like C-terminal domain-containing protein n=1 Tax=Elsinoe australis TaxID=40998 RepID=A0A4U7AJU2_9PEZI|nr:hypothetical protein C1H76_9671 [Elsinoe australis]